MSKFCYVAINGLPGCLPDSVMICHTKKDAIRWLTDLYDIAPYGRVAHKLYRFSSSYLNHDILEIEKHPVSRELFESDEEYEEFIS